jgi:hypothetical protein
MNVGIVELDGRVGVCYDRLADHPTNTISMVVQFAATAAWLWRIGYPDPGEPL